MKRTVFGMMLVLLLIITSQLTFNIQSAEKSETICFRLSDSIHPSTTLTQRDPVSAFFDAPAVEWNKTYGGTLFDVVKSVIQTNDGGYATAVYTKSFGAGDGDFWLVKLAPEHDVAVIDITPAKIVVDQNCSLNVNVTVENQGVYTETFGVTLYANSTMIHAKAITLTAGNPKTVTFSWNTTGFARGNYTVSACIEPLLGEIHTANNILVDGQIAVVPEFASFPILPLFMMATLLVVIVFRRKYTK